MLPSDQSRRLSLSWVYPSVTGPRGRCGISSVLASAGLSRRGALGRSCTAQSVWLSPLAWVTPEGQEANPQAG